MTNFEEQSFPVPNNPNVNYVTYDDKVQGFGSTKWEINVDAETFFYAQENGITHLIPIADSEAHSYRKCRCNPDVISKNDEPIMYIHFAFDNRELIEAILNEDTVKDLDSITTLRATFETTQEHLYGEGKITEEEFQKRMRLFDGNMQLRFPTN